MRTTIVTGFSAKGYGEYGRRFMETFAQHNSGHDLHVYTEDVPLLGGCKQFQQGDIPGLNEFIRYAAGVPEAQGKKDNGSWRPKETRAKYSYRFDAFKFCRMVFTMHAAAHHIGEGYMVWLDGDTVVQRAIPEDLAERSLPGRKDYAYLGREPKHTETGYLVFRLPEALPLLNAWAHSYRHRTFLLEEEWHSAYLFDRARERCPGTRGHNLTPGGRGHVIHQCWVGGIFDHQKGARKGMKKSPEAK